jgi:hypothetical protein
MLGASTTNSKDLLRPREEEEINIMENRAEIKVSLVKMMYRHNIININRENITLLETNSKLLSIMQASNSSNQWRTQV